jgi:two-component system chemotaxis sensor kinase CheA
MLGNTNFAINMECISETVKVEAKAIEYINEQPVLKLRGALIPLVFYYDLLSKDIKEKSEYSLLIIESGGVKFGFVVDAFVSQLDIVQKPPSSYLANHRFISGTSLLGNGEVLFLINASKLIMKKEK